MIVPKISDLIRLKDRLILLREELVPQSRLSSTVHFLTSQKDNISITEEGSLFLEKLVENYKDLSEKETEIISLIDKKISILNERIDNESSKKFSQSEYREGFHETQLSDPREVDQETQRIIDSRLSIYAQPNYSSMILNPRTKEIINPLVASDPLYICQVQDFSDDSGELSKLIEHFPEMYQRRLRLYHDIRSYNFTILPQHQMAFVVCWNIFEHISLDRIETYIKKVYDLLKPGGTFMFSFNNCDLAPSMEQAEKKVESYSSAKKLIEYSEMIGYKITKTENHKMKSKFEEYVSWMEITKPGDLKTVKIRQVLGRVIPN